MAFNGATTWAAVVNVTEEAVVPRAWMKINMQYAMVSTNALPVQDVIDDGVIVLDQVLILQPAEERLALFGPKSEKLVAFRTFLGGMQWHLVQFLRLLGCAFFPVFSRLPSCLPYSSLTKVARVGVLSAVGDIRDAAAASKDGHKASHAVDVEKTSTSQ